MTSQEQLAMRNRLEEVLGPEHAATLIAMTPDRDDLVTRPDLGELRTEMAELRTELKAEIAQFRADMGRFKTELKGELSRLRTEMNLKFATRDDLVGMSEGFTTKLHSFVRTFIITQVVSIVGVAGIVVGLLQFL